MIVIFFIKTGYHLSYHIVTNVEFSADLGLTVVFEMGTGVSIRRIVTGMVIKRFELFLSLKLITNGLAVHPKGTLSLRPYIITMIVK